MSYTVENPAQAAPAANPQMNESNTVNRNTTVWDVSAKFAEKFEPTEAQANEYGQSIIDIQKGYADNLNQNKLDRAHNRKAKMIEALGDGIRDSIKATFTGIEMYAKMEHAAWVRGEMGEYQDHKIAMDEKAIALQEKAMTEGVKLQEKAISAKKQIALAEIAEKGKTARNGQNKVAMRMRIRAQGRPARVFV